MLKVVKSTNKVANLFCTFKLKCLYLCYKIGN